MRSDVVDLRDFYETQLGRVARDMIRRGLQETWPDIQDKSLLGLGYTTPFLRPFLADAERVLSFMPAQQGVLHWPSEGPNMVSLVDETDLPLPDYSVDRVLLVHSFESSEYLRDMLSEIWRVLTGDGRLLVVAPNRRGIWARMDRTPFGWGHPYSAAQLSRVLRDHLFTPAITKRALFVPPTNSRTLLRSSQAIERMGRRFFPHVSGVVMIEAAKQLYAATPVRERKSLSKPVLVHLPQAAGQAPRAISRKPIQ
ncbi:MAG: methyltransferase domain-containing protein [Pseudomonadota bacterium]